MLCSVNPVRKNDRSIFVRGGVVATNRPSRAEWLDDRVDTAVTVVGKAQPWASGQSKQLSNRKKATTFAVQEKVDDFVDFARGMNDVASSTQLPGAPLAKRVS